MMKRGNKLTRPCGRTLCPCPTMPKWFERSTMPGTTIGPSSKAKKPYSSLPTTIGRISGCRGCTPRKECIREAIAESETVLRAMPNSSVGLTELAYSLAAGGRQLEARKVLQRLEQKSKRDFVPAYNLAV